ncbi:MAG: hypothetical protein JOY93_07360 [Acidobacteriales bacterium]|nr:hypothetical protein [Terriglobales bacterium]
MPRNFPFKTLAIILFSSVAAFASRDTIPAGTILQCTLNEPNFSAKTAAVNDPVLCDLAPLHFFGHSVFPRGAELSGRLRDYKNPGFWGGKGWIAFEFDRIILPGSEILPVSSKVISVPKKLKVDARGEIRGKGAYPILKGETRISLRLMDDLELSYRYPRVSRSVPMPPWAGSSGYRPASDSTPQMVNPAPRVMLIEANYTPQSSPERPSTTPRVAPELAAKPQPQAIPQAAPEQLTVIVLKDGTACTAREYWVEAEHLSCVSEQGVPHLYALSDVDMDQTRQINRERNVQFALQSSVITEQ